MAEDDEDPSLYNWLLDHRELFYSNIDRVYVYQAQQILETDRVTKKLLQGYFLTEGAYDRFLSLVRRWIFDGEAVVFEGTSDPAPKRPDRTERDERMPLTDRQRTRAVVRFLKTIVPAYENAVDLKDGRIPIDPKDTATLLRVQEEAFQLQVVGNDFADGTTTIEPVLAQLFKMLPTLRASPDYLNSLWNPEWLNTLQTDARQDAIDQVVAYLRKVPDTRKQVQDALFGSEHAFARHIQWAYDRFLVQAGFKHRQLFKGVPHDDGRNPPLSQPSDQSEWGRVYREDHSSKGDFGDPTNGRSEDERNFRTKSYASYGDQSIVDIFNEIEHRIQTGGTADDIEARLHMTFPHVRVIHIRSESANSYSESWRVEQGVEDMLRYLDNGGNPQDMEFLRVLRDTREHAIWALRMGDPIGAQEPIDNPFTPCHACGRQCTKVCDFFSVFSLT